MSKVIKACDLAVRSNPFVVPSEDGPAAAGLGELETAAAVEELDGFGEEFSEPQPDYWGNPDDPEAGVARGVINEARKEAERLVAEAGAKARALAEQAAEEAQALRQKAWDEGFGAGREAGEGEGHAAGVAEARTEMAEAVARAARFLQDCQAAKARILAGSRDEVLKIVAKCAEKIVRTSVSLDPDVVVRAIAEALELVAEKSRLLIRVNPAEVARAREAETHFLQFLPSSTQLEVLGDAAVQPGGCFIESVAGGVDARVETQLEEIMSQLEAAVHAG